MNSAIPKQIFFPMTKFSFGKTFFRSQQITLFGTAMQDMHQRDNQLHQESFCLVITLKCLRSKVKVQRSNHPSLSSVRLNSKLVKHYLQLELSIIFRDKNPLQNIKHYLQLAFSTVIFKRPKILRRCLQCFRGSVCWLCWRRRCRC